MYIVVISKITDNGIAISISVLNVPVICRPNIIGNIGPQQADPDNNDNIDPIIPAVSDILHFLVV